MISSASVNMSSRLNWTRYPEAPSTGSQLHSMKSSPDSETRRFAGTLGSGSGAGGGGAGVGAGVTGVGGSLSPPPQAVTRRADRRKRVSGKSRPIRALPGSGALRMFPFGEVPTP